MRSKKSRLPIGKRNLRVELEATSEGTRTATIAIDVSSGIIARVKLKQLTREISGEVRIIHF